MAPRAYWKGHLRLSLVACPIQLFPAISEREKVRFHLINRKTGNRIKHLKIDAETGEQVDPEDVVMGYEASRGHYVEIPGDKLEAVSVQATRTLEIKQFVPRAEIDDLYLNNPYYIAPDGEVALQTFAVIREAMKREGMVALGHVIFTTREHMIAIEPRGKGLLGVTLRYPYQIREEEKYFGDLPDEKVPKEMLDLAANIVATKAGHFDPKTFEDNYEKALKELIKRKQRGMKIERPQERASAKVINLMDALRQSVAGKGGSKPRAQTGRRPSQGRGGSRRQEHEAG